MTEPEVVRVSTAGLAAAVPHLLGYRPGTDHIVVVGRVGARLSPAAAIEWREDWPPAPIAAGQFADQVVPPFEAHGIDGYIVLGYGENGAARAIAAANAIAERSFVRSYIERFHIVNDTIRQYDKELGWLAPEPIPNLDAEFAFQGSSPQPDRDSKVASFLPLEAPLWAAPSQAEQDYIRACSPSERARMAVELMTRMTQLQAPRESAHFARLGHLMSTDLLVRDCVISSGAQNADRTNLLVDLYRSAPAEYRDVTASAAAYVCLSRGDTIGARTINEQVSQTSPHSGLSVLTELVVDTNPSPARMREINAGSAVAIANRLLEADQAWLSTQHAAPARTHPSSAQRRHTPQSGTGPVAGPAPATSGGFER